MIIFSHDKPVIGMLHAPSLPGSPRHTLKLSAIIDLVKRDAEALASGGVHGLMLENYHDVPFYPKRVPAHVVADMTAIALAVRSVTNLPLGINVLRNDGRSALAVAHAAGAQFIRVNILCGARVTDQGVIEGIAHELLRDRAMLGHLPGAQDIAIFADVQVKHSAPLGEPRPLEEEIADTIGRGLADAIIITGGATGQPASEDDLRRARAAAGNTRVFVGSGVNESNITSLLALADGAIVGTSLKTGERIDASRVRSLITRASEGPGAGHR